MSSEQPLNFSSVWADLRQVSFAQGFIDAGGVRTRFIQSGCNYSPPGSKFFLDSVTAESIHEHA